jgi:hypothetical protein
LDHALITDHGLRRGVLARSCGSATLPHCVLAGAQASAGLQEEPPGRRRPRSRNGRAIVVPETIGPGGASRASVRESIPSRDVVGRRRATLNGMTIRGIDHVQLAAPYGCESEARRFYGDVLGLVEIDKPAALKARGGVWFRLGQQQLHIGVEAQFAPGSQGTPGAERRERRPRRAR